MVGLHRMPSRCTSGHTWRRSRTCARSAAEASGRRARWCGTCGTTRARSPSSATSVAAALPSMAHSTGTCAPKVGPGGGRDGVGGRGRPALTELPATGGCLLEVEELLVSEESPAAAAAVLADDPHTVLVEFSSVVADTQEYIIEVGMGPPEFGWGLGRARLTSDPPSRPLRMMQRPAKPRRSSRAPRQR